MSITAAFLILLAYLLGSVSSAVIVCKTLGKQDPREIGSNNPGATNVYRIAGTGAALFTLMGDIAKGLVPVWLAVSTEMSVVVQSFVAIAALLGHCYPLYFKFKGGKGVATVFGSLIIIHWEIGLSLLGIWLAMMVISRTSSIAALVAALTVPLSTFYVLPEAMLPMCAMALLVIWRHHDNIIKILGGNENTFKD